MIQKAHKNMGNSNMKYFYSIYLLPENQCTPQDFNIIKGLIKKDIFHPIIEENQMKKEITK
jgi:hypothetical protein